jgi:predicted RecB family nuclease
VQRVGERLVFSASDLNNFLECAHLSELDRRAASGELRRPDPSASAALIAAKGESHERRYLERLKRAFGAGVVEFPDRPASTVEGLEEAEARTVAAMSEGAEIIYQATFFDGHFLGRADFLRKVPVASERWPWSYYVVDTKLAHNAKPYFLVQLCNYAEHVARIQGTHPEYASIVAGSGIEQRFALADYMAYYRHLKDSFLARAAKDEDGTYPDEVPHCQICAWNPLCAERRDRDDYLGIVATMRRDGIRRLQASHIPTLAALAYAAESQRPPGMSAETFARLRAQARLQHEQRTTGKYVYELLPFQEQRGLALLPQPDPHDVFFDMEGDPLYTAEHGLEYLFGFYTLDARYTAFWAKEPREERNAFELLVDALVERRRMHPGMHVYHYASYETDALKRLAGRYGSRQEELDVLLRAQSFVNLYPIVRQSLRISQPSYSIKKLEPFYGFTRSTRTQRGDDSILMFESWLVERDDNILVDIENYNRDDCISTLRLRDWLLERRDELEKRSGAFGWRELREPEQIAQLAGDRERVRAALLDGLQGPETSEELRSLPAAFQARWLLGHLLDYHRSEEKPSWWAYFHRCDNRDEIVESDRHAIGGLIHRADTPPYKARSRDKNLVHVYTFPEQLHDFAEGDTAYVLDDAYPRSAGTIVKLDTERLELHLKVANSVDPASIDALSPQPVVATTVLRDALLRVARSYLEGNLQRDRSAAYELLLRCEPRIDWGRASLGDLALSLDRSYLFVQGPPGSGKSTKGAAMILDLIAAGKRVAIMANAHKAIHNLLDKIEEQALERQVTFRGIQRYSAGKPGTLYASRHNSGCVTPEAGNDALFAPHDLAAGTAWVFSREDLVGRYDYLVIDEAGQVCLANAIACAPCARNLVLLGDPLQLAQVSQGAHPPGIELSVLEHLLAGEPTVPPRRGVFLDRSYRMHPEICDFISRAVYAGRLRAAENTAAHCIDSPGLCGSGLRYIPISHLGNSRESPEEAAAIVREIESLLRGSYQLRAGETEQFEQRHVLVVSPYNAQRRLLREHLRTAGFDRVRVGTVDAFQGLQAPVVFYSMATSSGDDLPRGLGFLFEKNRLNVAISRAQCLSVLVCSPRLLEVSCSTPEQMALVNVLCSFAENARSVTAPRD